jgi:hypothetical protein
MSTVTIEPQTGGWQPTTTIGRVELLEEARCHGYRHVRVRDGWMAIDDVLAGLTLAEDTSNLPMDRNPSIVWSTVTLDAGHIEVSSVGRWVGVFGPFELAKDEYLVEIGEL